MNNSTVALDNLTEARDTQTVLQERKGVLSQVVEAISEVEQSGAWQKLKRLVLDDVVQSLERLLLYETSKKVIDTPELYRIQGQLIWARRYADLKKLLERERQQLENIKNQL